MRSEHLAADEIEFMRWRADRCVKLRHMQAVLWHGPLFVLRHTRQMIAHTFRGSTLKSILGLEDARQVFERYRALRQVERKYL